MGAVRADTLPDGHEARLACASGRCTGSFSIRKGTFKISTKCAGCRGSGAAYKPRSGTEDAVQYWTCAFAKQWCYKSHPCGDCCKAGHASETAMKTRAADYERNRQSYSSRKGSESGSTSVSSSAKAFRQRVVQVAAVLHEKGLLQESGLEPQQIALLLAGTGILRVKMEIEANRFVVGTDDGGWRWWEQRGWGELKFKTFLHNQYPVTHAQPPPSHTHTSNHVAHSYVPRARVQHVELLRQTVTQHGVEAACDMIIALFGHELDRKGEPVHRLQPSHETTLERLFEMGLLGQRRRELLQLPEFDLRRLSASVDLEQTVPDKQTVPFTCDVTGGPYRCHQASQIVFDRLTANLPPDQHLDVTAKPGEKELDAPTRRQCMAWVLQHVGPHSEPGMRVVTHGKSAESWWLKQGAQVPRGCDVMLDAMDVIGAVCLRRPDMPLDWTADVIGHVTGISDLIDATGIGNAHDAPYDTRRTSSTVVHLCAAAQRRLDDPRHFEMLKAGAEQKVQRLQRRWSRRGLPEISACEIALSSAPTPAGASSSTPTGGSCSTADSAATWMETADGQLVCTVVGSRGKSNAVLQATAKAALKANEQGLVNLHRTVGVHVGHGLTQVAAVQEAAVHAAAKYSASSSSGGGGGGSTPATSSRRGSASASSSSGSCSAPASSSSRHGASASTPSSKRKAPEQRPMASNPYEREYKQSHRSAS